MQEGALTTLASFGRFGLFETPHMVLRPEAESGLPRRSGRGMEGL